LPDFDDKQNMSFLDYYLADFRQYLFLLKEPLNYPKTFRNFFHVFINKIKKNYPIKCVLQNGNTIIAPNFAQLRNIKLGSGNCFFENELMVVKLPHYPKVKIEDWEKNGDIGAVFFSEEYSFLPVKDKVVIDIGANIGDTALYFVSRGAKKVIGVEPSRQNYESAKKNIALNNLSDKIELVLAGCSSKKGTISIDSNLGGSQVSLNDGKKGGSTIPLITIEDILKERESNDNYVLKMDCEGCEYDIILSSHKEIMKKFSHIQVEYHAGYQNIKNQLESFGFEVMHSAPRIAFTMGKFGRVGYLYAKNKSL
jgi:FkbM family methyltransferase